MKLTIEHSKTKRRIEGAFNICGSWEDLTSLVKQLQAQIDNPKFSYGWVNIVVGKQDGIADAPTQGWDE